MANWQKNALTFLVIFVTILLIQISNGKQHRCKSPEDCGLKARCKTKYGSKLGVCVCERGYIGDPRVECERRKCNSTKDCDWKGSGFCNTTTELCQCEEGYIGDGFKCVELRPRKCFFGRKCEERTNIAKGRPAAQISTEGQGSAGNAVDGNRSICAKTKKGSRNPWWRVDLEYPLWVDKVLITSKTSMEGVDIRIGNETNGTNVANRLCRQGLEVPSEPWLYTCGEEILGRYVHIRLMGTQALMLCEVEVYMSGEPFYNSEAMYFTPSVDGGVMLKGEFVRFADRDHVYLKISKSDNLHKVHLRDLVIHNIGVRQFLPKYEDEIIFPGHDYQYCGRWINGTRFGVGTIDGYDFHYGWRVKFDYIPHQGKYRRRKIDFLHCPEVLYKDICKESFCSYSEYCYRPSFSHLFPPGSYYCKCKPGYSTDIRLGLHRPFYNPETEANGKGCELPPYVPPNSKENLVKKYGKETEASSVDVYNGCKHKHCDARSGLSRFAVDGAYKTCFVSLTEHSPWFVVHLYHYHPISLINVYKGHRPQPEVMMVLIANHGIYARCATIETSLPRWSTECKTNKTTYIWGNAVRIETKAKILKLCEVKVFAETFGNIAVDHHSTDREYINKTFPTTVGSLGGSRCIFSTIKSCGHQTTSCIRWRMEFGSNLRVAGVFLKFKKESHRNISTIIKTGMGKNERICFGETSAYYHTPAVYHWCKNTHVASYVEMGIGSLGLQICGVEIFQTRTINVAARRKARKFALWGSSLIDSDAGVICDQDMYTKIWAYSESWPWFAVDLLTMIEVYLIRIRAEYFLYRTEHRVFIGPSYQEQRWVSNVSFSAKETIRDLRLWGNNVGRTVGVQVQTTDMQFEIRELEIYNGRLPEIENKCLKEDYCPPNFKCKTLPAEFLCECPTEGFRYVKGGNGTSEQCLDINECTIKSLCPAHSYCTNTVGSYQCVCEKGYEAINDSNHRLEKCEDINECEDLFRVVYSTPCHFDSKCINLPGSYTCKCLPGYKASQNRDYCVKNKMYTEDCLDVDECRQETHRCHLNATCTNTIGSYSCRCFSGMKGDGRTCIALDPCTKERKCKRHYQKCLHINGEFLCDCVDGYSNRLRDCEDSNECDLDENICGNNSVCNNTVGSYRCLCKPGFYDASGNGTNCIDINECALEKTICGDNAVCNNIHGSYGCECSPGFQSTNGNGVDCTDVNECTLDQNICGCYSLCKNNKGSYHCKCSPGFHSATGDGRNCKDINECEKGNVCGKGGKCVNMIGSYICLCFSKGFTYDPKMRSCLGSFTAAAGSKMYLYSPVIPLTGLFLKFAFRLAHF